MASINVLSWNIQKFGADKAKDEHFLRYVAYVVGQARADVVGIMEVVGQVGTVLVSNLLPFLNNLDTAATWRGVAGRRTAAAPNEQYVLLWRADRLEVTDGPRMIGVLAGPEFDKFLLDHMIDDRDALLASLVAHRYIDKHDRVNPRAYGWLVNDKAPLDLETHKNKKLHYKLNDAKKRVLTALLTADAPQFFPARKARPPLVATVRPKGTTIDIRLALLHAPGPGFDPPRTAMQLKLITGLEGARAAVVMGDFNLNAQESARVRALESFDIAQGRVAYVYTARGEKVECLAFQPLTGPALKAKPADPRFQKTLGFKGTLEKEKTSLVKTIMPDLIATKKNVDALRANEYDRFFVIGKGEKPGVYDVIDAAVPKQWADDGRNFEPRSTTKTPYDAQLAKLASKVHDRWWKRASSKAQKQTKRKRKKKKGVDTDLLKEAPRIEAKQITSLREAQYSYILGVSDHLPVALELVYA